MKKKILLKLGGRKHLGEGRWNAALELYDEIHCVCLYREAKTNIENEKVVFHEFQHTWVNQKLTGLLTRTKGNRRYELLNWVIIGLFRLYNYKIIKDIAKISNPDVLCSYGDYDWSDLCCLICAKVIKTPIVRSYKESRVGYNFLEYHALRIANTVVLYHEELKSFLEGKYSPDIWNHKKVLLGYDENALPSIVLNNINYKQKFSEVDGKVHLVILSYRVDSSPNRKRDEGRYYYVDVIKELLEVGIIVHLHCAEFINFEGVNKYEELKQEYPNRFFMEKPLIMKHDSSIEEWIKSCEILSRYDFGLLHNIVAGSSVSEFDKINVPHRFFAYQAAHVVPILLNGHNCVLQSIFEERKCGCIYNSYQELINLHKENYDFYNPCYEDYLAHIFRDN